MKKNIISVVSVIIALISVFIYINTSDDKIITNNTDDRHNINTETIQEREKYKKCMDEPYKMSNLEKLFDDLFLEYKGEGIAIYFNELKNEYSYKFNANKIYYSASAIKLYDAIYLIENAKNGNLSLDETITYTSKDKKAGSEKTDKHNFGDKISLNNLIDYELSVSDNAAHSMLVKYIDANKLNNYFKTNGNVSLGLTNAKPYCYNYTIEVANTSLERIYDILKANDKYSNLIRTAMNNDYGNGLDFDEVNMLHKYGLFNNYYHDIGIYESDNPYLISILTLYGEKDYKKLVQTIHKKIYEIYKNNLEEKKAYCLNKAM